MKLESTGNNTDLSEYIRLREEKENIENVFFEPVGDSNSSRDEIMFNIVTALLKNGFEPDDKVEHWYSNQKNLRKDK